MRAFSGLKMMFTNINMAAIRTMPASELKQIDNFLLFMMLPPYPQLRFCFRMMPVEINAKAISVTK